MFFDGWGLAHHAILAPTAGSGEGVAFGVLVGRNALPLQPQEPVLADELAVGQQGSDLIDAKDVEETFHHGDPLGRVGVARSLQHRPVDGRAMPSTRKLMFGFAELPVRAVRRQAPRTVADGDEAHR